MGAPVAALFCRADSVYRTLDGVDVWDVERDARRWPGGCPLVAHPPCRTWGSLSHMATRARPDEKQLAVWAVDQIRQWGGVLEHPKASKLWPHLNLPEPWTGEKDAWGGWTLEVAQYWWGHRCEKMTRLYIVGSGMRKIPTVPQRAGRPTHVITQGIRKGNPMWRPRVPNWEREATPPAFAEWLVELARRCGGRENSLTRINAELQQFP